MNKVLLALLVVFMFGCKEDTAKLDQCLSYSAQLADRGYAANSQEFIIIVNSCMGNAKWQKTARGKEVIEALKKAGL